MKPTFVIAVTTLFCMAIFQLGVIVGLLAYTDYADFAFGAGLAGTLLLIVIVTVIIGESPQS